MRFPLSPCPHQHFFNYSHLSSCEVVYHYRFTFSLMTNNVELLFMGILAICISYLKECLFRSFVLFQIGFSFYCWFIIVFYIFLIQILCQKNDLQIFSHTLIFSLSWSCPTFPFCSDGLVIYIFSFVDVLLVIWLPNHCLILAHDDLFTHIIFS